MNTEAQNYEVRSISKNKAKQNFKSENIRLIIVTLLSIALYEAQKHFWITELLKRKAATCDRYF